jgi:hypothetical protein
VDETRGIAAPLFAALALFVFGVGVGLIYATTISAPKPRQVIFTIPVVTTVTVVPPVTITQQPPPLLP